MKTKTKRVSKNDNDESVAGQAKDADDRVQDETGDESRCRVQLVVRLLRLRSLVSAAIFAPLRHPRDLIRDVTDLHQQVLAV